MENADSKLTQRVTYLRNLLIAHVTGRTVNETDYRKLRQYFMAMPGLKDVMPDVVSKNPDLAAVWQHMKYSSAGHNERREQLEKVFKPLLAKASGGIEESEQALDQVDQGRLLQTVQKANMLTGKAPDVAVQQMQSLIELLCRQVLNQMKVQPDPTKTDICELISLTERSLEVGPGRRNGDCLKQLTKGLVSLNRAIEALYAENSHLKLESGQIGVDSDVAVVLVQLYAGLGSMLLGCLNTHKLAPEGQTSH